MFTLKQTFLLCGVTSEMEKDLRTANGPILHLEFLRNFNKRSRTFKALNQQLAQKVCKCVNMFLETGCVLCKKGSRRRTKRSAENIEEVEQRIAEISDKSIWRLTQETNLSFGAVQVILKKDLHFFPYRVSVVHEIKPLNNKNPHSIDITSLNIDR
jgi:ribosomal protein L20A (L18A)